MSPQVHALGFSLVDLTMALVVLAYFSGLWTQCVAYLVDGAFLASRIDPSRTLWNEIIGLGITGPILCLIYQNSLLTVAAGIVAGLAQGFFVRAAAEKREAKEHELQSPANPPAGDRTLTDPA
jgi:hypothetical protein